MFEKELVEISKENFMSSTEVIRYLSEIAYKNGKVSDLEMFVKDVIQREESISTEVGHGIAIPHGESNAVNDTFVACVRLDNPILWNEEKVEFIFMIGVPFEKREKEHLKILALLSRNLMRESFREKLKNAKTNKDLYFALSEIEKEE